MYERRRNLVQRPDGRLVNVARPRGQIFVCSENCCCGRTEDGIPAVPVARYQAEWERRRLRNLVHLTVGGCLGPCALANVVLLLFEGEARWFHSMNSEPLVDALFDYVEARLDADEVALSAPLDAHQFTASAWQPRPDGLPVDDVRPRDRAAAAAPERCSVSPARADQADAAPDVDRLVADMEGAAAAPRKNGELVFDEPWQGRAFGMVVAASDHALYPWEDFRRKLIVAIGDSDARGDPAGYYERWLAAFEALLAEQGVISAAELDERTYQFEFGERDEVF